MQVRQGLGWGPDDLVISYVSRIAPEKNVSYLADALAIVAARRPDVRILFVGDGPTRGELERRIGSIASFAGYRTGQDLADHYAAGDIFAFSSLTETFGNVVLEAMASGMPVVALRAGGVGDTVQHGTTGLLVEPADPPDRFAEAVLSLVAEPERRRAMSQAARAYARSQSWDAIMGGLRDRYELAIAGEPAAAPRSRELDGEPAGGNSRTRRSARDRPRGPARPRLGTSRDGRYRSRRNVSKLGERDIAREDQGRGPVVAERPHDLRDPGLDQRMVPLGLVAEQVVHEEVPRHAVELAVEVERALPAPDVEMRVRPDRRTAGLARCPGPAARPTGLLPCSGRSAPAGEREDRTGPGWHVVSAIATTRNTQESGGCDGKAARFSCAPPALSRGRLPASRPDNRASAMATTRAMPGVGSR